MSKHRPVVSDNLPKPRGPYTPAVGFERLVFVSGQGAVDPATGELVGTDIEAQTEQCLKNIRAILDAGGSGLPYVLRCGVFLVDVTEFSRMNDVYQRMFGNHRPARTTIQAAALPAPGLRVEIDAIAYVPARQPRKQASRKSASRSSGAAAGRAATRRTPGSRGAGRRRKPR